mmetsp:Transcript_9186/g.13905  ORF Transcript_9186/g.13905 Transcript_9186/m.13905 type:complete len:87 (-) Transcript_9186:1322-1582(-)
MEEEFPYTFEAVIPYPKNYAEMVMTTMEVDQEVKPHVCRRKYSVSEDEKNFIVFFEAKSAHSLRTSVQTFYDMTILATRTANAFDC